MEIRYGGYADNLVGTGECEFLPVAGEGNTVYGFVCCVYWVDSEASAGWDFVGGFDHWD